MSKLFCKRTKVANLQMTVRQYSVFPRWYLFSNKKRTLIYIWQDIKAENDVEFTVDTDQPVIVPIKSEKFREKMYSDNSVGGISYKSFHGSENGQNNPVFAENEDPPSYTDVRDGDVQMAKTEL